MPELSSSMPCLRAATIAIGGLTLATLLTFPLARYVTHSRELLLIAAIVMTSRYAGAAAGLLVALASLLAFDWFFDSTPHALDFTAGGVLRAIAFGSVSGLVTFLERQRRHAMGRLETANKELQTALSEIKTLRGLLPICSYCKQIRTDIGSWMGFEEYVRTHTNAEFTHGICPNCLRKHFADSHERRYGSKAA
jgi:K+-sensing histidine kinase KdpD